MTVHPKLDRHREPNAPTLDLQAGDELVIVDMVEGLPVASGWRVVHRVAGGWRMESTLGGDTRTWTDLEILDLRLDLKMTLLRRNPFNLPEAKLRRVTSPIETKPPRLRLELERRNAYCKRVATLVDELRQTGFVLGILEQKRLPEWFEKACRTAASEVFAENIEQWRSRVKELKSIKLSVAAGREVVAGLDDAKAAKADALRLPSAKQVAKWYLARNASDRPNVILTPDYAARGNRVRRKKELVGGRDVYAIMREYGDRYYASRERVAVNVIYRKIVREQPGFANVIPHVSTLRRFYDRTYKNSFDWMLATEGREAATREHQVSQRSQRPTLPMQEIEIDHCLVDLIVVDEVSGRPLGRPWVTAAIDRCTRMIVGIHVSFEHPSWASVGRCLAHAFWPKDLRAYRKENVAEGEFYLENEWPCEGIAGTVITDRGKEFTGESMEASADALKFAHGLLPGRMPWLKATIERFFGTMHSQVYSYLEGKTFESIAKRGDYKSVANASVSLPELRRRLLSWIVDDYHVTFHEGLGDYPIRAWRVGMQHHRLRMVPDIAYLHQVLGEHRIKPISRNGVRLENHHYYDDLFRELIRRNGPKHRYHVRYDPFDLGRIWLQPDIGGDYVEIQSDRPAETVGVSVYQSRIRRLARKTFGGRMSALDDQALKRELDRAAAAEIADTNGKTTIAAVARYHLPNGTFFTPVGGWDGVPEPYEAPAVQLEAIPASVAPEAVERPPAIALLEEAGPGDESGMDALSEARERMRLMRRGSA